MDNEHTAESTGLTPKHHSCEVVGCQLVDYLPQSVEGCTGWRTVCRSCSAQIAEHRATSLSQYKRPDFLESTLFGVYKQITDDFCSGKLRAKTTFLPPRKCPDLSSLMGCCTLIPDPEKS